MRRRRACRYYTGTISPNILRLSSHAGVAACLAIGLLDVLIAQPSPVRYVVHLASATGYDTRARDEDTIHASLAVFVNGEERGIAIWDGKGWDGSRAEGRRWVTGLHLFGPATGSTVRVETGPLEDSDTLHIVFQIHNSSADVTKADHRGLASRIEQSSCSGADGTSVWDCLAKQQADGVARPSATGCDGLVAADKLALNAMQLRKKTETGAVVTLSNTYRGTAAPPSCGQSIYGAVVTVARQ